MATKTPIKLVDLGSGQGALKEFEVGDTLPAAVLPTTDGITEGTTNLYFTNTRVRSTVLTGLSVTNSPIVAADTVLAAAGKAQGQINAKAASGSNSDITSLGGLTTALSVAQGGTGGNTQAAARTGLGLGTAAVANIVGTVSQSGGVPTGAVIERGTGANGEYTKYADGTLECWLVTAAMSHTAAVDLVTTWTLPAAVVSLSTAICSVYVRSPLSTNSYVVNKLQGAVASTTTASFRTQVSATQDYQMYFHLKGRWF